MSNPSELPAAASNPDDLPGEPWNEERLAAILLRLLGVYFTGWAVISGVEEAVRFGVASVKFGLDVALPSRWTYFVYLAAQFAFGAYLLFGGRWVYEKVLTPIVYVDPDDLGLAAASENPVGTDRSPSGETEQLC